MNAAPLSISAEGKISTLAFLFTDIEGSTVRWERYPEAMRVSLARHDGLLRQAITRHGGLVFKTVGDAFCAAFEGASAALSAAVEAHLALAGDGFAEVDGLKVRMALNAGQVEARDGDFFGRPLNLVARLLSAAHGGQIVLSAATADLLSEALPAGTSLDDLGLHRLRDIATAQRIYQLRGPELAGGFPPLRSLDGMPSNLPRLAREPIGRERDLVDIEELLRRKRCVTLAGPGGIGKTTLALQVGADLSGHYPDGVWFAELAPLDKQELVDETIAVIFNLPGQQGRSTIEMVAAFLKRKRLLLILDNCEHLIAAASRAADAILRACPEVSILASSREALGIPGEHAYQVALLDIPRRGAAITAVDAMRYSAIRLFVERAEAALGQFSLGDESVEVIIDICRRLDGIPLAIELAAPRLKMLKPADLLRRLDDCLKILTGGNRTVLPRQQTLRALIDWSYALLSEGEQVLLSRLGIFCGSFTLDAAGAVAKDPPIDEWDVFDLLAALVDKSLVVRLADTGEVRYRLLESTRAFALEKLKQRGETHLLGCLCHHMIDVFRTAEHTWATEATETILAACEPELDNLRAALGWALVVDGNPDLGLELVGHTTWLWRDLHLLQEGRRWLETAGSFIGPATPPVIEARIRLALGWSPYAGDGSRLPHNRRAIALLRTGAHPDLLGQALAQAGQCISRYRDVAEAREYLDEAIAILRPLGQTKWLAIALNYAAISRKHNQEIAAARAFVEEAQILSGRLGDVWLHDACAVQLASIAFEGDELAEAIERATSAVATCRAHGNLRNEFVALQWLAGYLLVDGRVDDGFVRALKAFELSRTLGNVNYPDSIDQLALVAADRSDFKTAAGLAGFAAAYADGHRISRYGIAVAIRNRLMSSLHAQCPPDICCRLMAEGSAWSESDLTTAVRTLTSSLDATLHLH